jgi:hypothetical protein
LTRKSSWDWAKLIMYPSCFSTVMICRFVPE